MATFGYTVPGMDSVIMTNIAGIRVRVPTDGDITSMSFYRKLTTERNVKMALYSYTGDFSTATLIAETEEITVDTDVLGWYTANFVTPVSVNKNDQMYLVAWGSGSGVSVAWDLLNSTDMFWLTGQTYSTFPNTLDGSSIFVYGPNDLNRHLSIYCTYTDTSIVPVTETKIVEHVMGTSAELKGKLWSLAGEANVNVHFEVKEAPQEWNQAVSTTPQLLSTLVEFNAEVVGLKANTEYNVRAVVEWGTEIGYGTVLSFTTAQTGLAVQYMPYYNLARISQRGLYANIDWSMFRYNPNNAGENVIVYIFDAGVRVTHEELEGRWDYGWGYSTFDPEVDNDDIAPAHGTKMAGVVAGKTFGVAKKAVIVSIRVRDEAGNTPANQNFADACDWIIANHPVGKLGVALMAFPMGNTTEPDYVIHELDVLNLINANIAVVKSADNVAEDISNKLICRMSEVLTVGGSGITDSSGDNGYGPAVDLHAGNINIISIGRDSDIQIVRTGGTSAASAMAAGAMAIVRSAYPTLNAVEAKDYLVSMATKGVLTGANVETNGSPNKLLYTNTGHSNETAITYRDPDRVFLYRALGGGA